jgi:hypothetical protein
MESVYYETGKPGSFGGVRALARYGWMLVKKVKGFLETQDTYTLHKPIIKNFPRRETFAKGINDLFQADLADMQNLASHSDGYCYIHASTYFRGLDLPCRLETNGNLRWRLYSRRY